MIYKGVEIKEVNNKFRLISPENGTLRIFRTLEMAKHYIDNSAAIDSIKYASEI